MFDQMKVVGYSTSNAIILLGTMTIVITIYIFKFFVCVFAWISHKSTKKGKKLFEKLKYEVFYQDLIAIALEAFLELCISGYL